MKLNEIIHLLDKDKLNLVVWIELLDDYYYVNNDKLNRFYNSNIAKIRADDDRVVIYINKVTE